jgi:hypothetical protein
MKYSVRELSAKRPLSFIIKEARTTKKAKMIERVKR